MIITNVSHVLAIDSAIIDVYNKCQYKEEMTVKTDPEIKFIKTDDSEISWDNPLTINDGSTFGLEAVYNLSVMEEIITRVADGEITGMSSSISSLVGQVAPAAIIQGGFDIHINLNQGLGQYFSVNQDVLSTIKANPNSILDDNLKTLFNIKSISEASGIITMNIEVKSGVTGQMVLDAKDTFGELSLRVNNLFTLNPNLWDEVDTINKGEFAKLIEIDAPSTYFNVMIPPHFETMAGVFGQRNPFTGIKILTNSNYAKLNLGHIIAYDGNGNDTGTPPVDTKMPYNDMEDVKVLGRTGMYKEGYKFVEWNTLSDGLGTGYQPGDTFKIEKNVILYAIWEVGEEPVEDIDTPEEKPEEKDINNPKPEEDNKVNNSKTSDETQVALYAIITALSVLGLTTGLYLLKRKRA